MHLTRVGFWATACLCAAASAALTAEDWPEWRGHGRVGVWRDTGILDRFPEDGLTITWRTPIHAGYSGPAVSDGRVFVTDARRACGRVIERLVALDEETGAIQWTREWEADYSGLEVTFALGPQE